MVDRRFDLICLGRAAVDLYGEQIGSPLEDIQSFTKSLGGCAANIAVGAARQGLEVAMLTRVGDEHMGRFVVGALAAEGIDTSHVQTDPERLTALVLLSIRDRDTFPLIFYRENCADMAITESDIDREFIAASRALLVTGTHFSTAGVDAASRRAIEYARAAGTRVVFDIDYRPVLWRLTGHGEAALRFVKSDQVTEHLMSIVPHCDLVVGTEAEIHIAGGTTDTAAALRNIRGATRATLVLKRGPDGCIVFTGDIPARLEDGFVAPGIPVEILNVLGAGDAFMAGLLRGWIRGEPLEKTTLYANVCGALVVSRHGCSPAMPSRAEIDDFVIRRSEIERIDRDMKIKRLHRVATRGRAWPELCAIAFDHRGGLEAIAQKKRVGTDRLVSLKNLIAEGAIRAAAEAGTKHAGMIIDDRYGTEVLHRMTGSGWWLARAIEQSTSRGQRLLTFEGGPNVGSTLRAWPREHVAKCLVYYHPDDPENVRVAQENRIEQVYSAVTLFDRELLLEVIPQKNDHVDFAAVPRAVEHLYARGIYPDWWKLPPPRDDKTWARIAALIEFYDPHCRGVLLLGLDAPEEDLARDFRTAAGVGVCKGFAVGRTIFGAPAESWLSGAIDDAELISQIALRFARMIELWTERKSGGLAAEGG
jgi:5-dehydro-2-deoxygluconokinase